jgi:3-deoxy-D-manno-octulosonate 8-phosphate phosphatase KdsC-like HAD superfamily phosphatase
VEKLLRRAKLDWDAVCFVGDDVVDLGPLKRAGFAVAVGDARPEVKRRRISSRARRAARRGARSCGNAFESAG